MTSETDTGTHRRHEYALVLLIKEIMAQIDEVAAIRKSGGSANLSFALLQEMCGVLEELDDDLKEKYYEILVSTASKAEIVRPSVLSEDMIAASVAPKRRAIGMIAETLGLKAA